MMQYELISEKERLRQAVQWLSDTSNHSARGVEEACQRFDLSPLDEEFLLRYFVQKAQVRSTPPE
ncbi:hypothetical protein [uncultured Thiodictyon sp.]|uniref:hypothetical protein n=1 Tax=uncultured Thiodictyon sp. TaxID=1846217 RepID=UPI0025FC4059|nr:hypothetical protein [uncultured Thiodictyon sp.]